MDEGDRLTMVGLEDAACEASAIVPEIMLALKDGTTAQLIDLLNEMEEEARRMLMHVGTLKRRASERLKAKTA